MDAACEWYARARGRRSDGRRAEVTKSRLMVTLNDLLYWFGGHFTVGWFTVTLNHRLHGKLLVGWCFWREYPQVPGIDPSMVPVRTDISWSQDPPAGLFVLVNVSHVLSTVSLMCSLYLFFFCSST